MSECINEICKRIGKWIPDVLLLSSESEGSPSHAKKKNGSIRKDCFQVKSNLLTDLWFTTRMNIMILN